MKKLLTLAVALSVCGYLSAQSTLPSAPGPQLLSSLQQQSPAPMPQAPAGTAPAIPDIAALPPNLPELTLAQAEQMAIRNNPRISVGKLTALAEHEVTLETRSAELPTVNAAATAEQAE